MHDVPRRSPDVQVSICPYIRIIFPAQISESCDYKKTWPSPPRGCRNVSSEQVLLIKNFLCNLSPDKILGKECAVGDEGQNFILKRVWAFSPQSRVNFEDL